MPSPRIKLVAGNWKMNLICSAAKSLAREVATLPTDSQVEVALCPAFVHLSIVGEAIRGSAVKLGSQNVYFEHDGAFTGEISVNMLADLGCQYIIVGHSERRLVLHEDNRTVNAKAKSALNGGCSPIVCVGETLDQREKGETKSIIHEQMNGSLTGLDEAACERLVIAYEPVWAIGTGRTATPEQAQEVHADLRNWLTKRYNAGLSSRVRLLYGGSVKPDNARELMSQPDIDGALVGGASLKCESFSQIIARAALAAK
jgi:triosephosphate isomerase